MQFPFSPLRLSLLSLFILRISSDSQNDRHLQSIASHPKNSAEEEEQPLLSTIPNLDRLPDLLIINPTFEPPQSHSLGQSATRRELLLRTLQLRQRPTEAERVSNVPKAQPLPKLDDQLLVGKQQLINAKRPKGKKETFTSPLDKLRNPPSLLIGPKNGHSVLKQKTPTNADSKSSTRRLKQQIEHSSTEESDSRLLLANWPSNSQQQKPKQLTMRKPAQVVVPYDNREQQPFAYQQQSLNSEQNSQPQLRPFAPVFAPPQQQLPVPFRPPRGPFPPPAERIANFNGQSPSVEANNFVYPNQQQQQQQQNIHFAEQQQKLQQIAAPRRLRFFFTPSTTTVNSDFTFAPGSPGFACFYGFPVPQYNTPRKRCIADHPMCGIQFTCVMDVHAVDEWGREVEQWWTDPNNQWNGAQPQQNTFGTAGEWGGGRTGTLGQPQQIREGRGTAQQQQNV
ncbi:hypothetical protein niasHT_023240 [Heterodera trifolii]|uniref:Uncharacterized protein n=1 Tax=Heterodera trifolii TaxID=157864 RepID=A0ABD2JDG8_9BILA